MDVVHMKFVIQSFNHPMVKVKGTERNIIMAKYDCFNHPMVKVKATDIDAERIAKLVSTTLW